MNTTQAGRLPRVRSPSHLTLIPLNAEPNVMVAPSESLSFGDSHLYCRARAWFKSFRAWPAAPSTSSPNFVCMGAGRLFHVFVMLAFATCEHRLTSDQTMSVYHNLIDSPMPLSDAGNAAAARAKHVSPRSTTSFNIHPPPPPPSCPTGPQYKYLGCYGDGQPRALTWLTSYSVSIEGCARLAHYYNYTVFGLPG